MSHVLPLGPGFKMPSWSQVIQHSKLLLHVPPIATIGATSMANMAAVVVLMMFGARVAGENQCDVMPVAD